MILLDIVLETIVRCYRNVTLTVSTEERSLISAARPSRRGILGLVFCISGLALKSAGMADLYTS